MIAIEATVEAEAWHPLLAGHGDVEAFARRAVEAALAVAPLAGAGEAEVSLLFTHDAAVAELNRAWRGKAGPTNVLSFPATAHPGAPGPRPLGDIALAVETVTREAQAEGKAPADHAAHLVVHGVLHLLGYDHGTDADAEAMEALERQALARLGIADPYRDMAA